MVRIKQTEFGIQPIKIGGGVVKGEGRAGNQLSGLHGVTLTRLQGRSTSRPRNGPTPRLSLIGLFPAALVSFRARGRSGFVLRPMGVTFPCRAARYRLEWRAVPLMVVPPTSITGLAGTSRSRTTRAEDQSVTRRLRAFFLLCRPRGTVAVLCLATSRDSLLATRSDALSRTTGNL